MRIETDIVNLDRRVAALETQVVILTDQYASLQARLEAIIGNPRNGVVEISKPCLVKLVSSFGSIGALVAQAESMFTCKTGDHRSHHQEWRNDEKASGYALYPYTCLALIAPAGVENAPEVLRQCMYTALFKLKATCKSERPTLYWRYAEQERIQEEYDGDPRGAGARYKIRTRIAIPEADFSVVDELIHTDTGAISVLRE